MTEQAFVISMLECAGFNVEWTSDYSVRIRCDGGWVEFQFIDNGKLFNITTEIA